MKRLLFIISLMFLQAYAWSQVSVSGSNCVIAGQQATYTFSGNWNGTTSMSWCVSGGTIVGAGGSCKSGTPVVQITVLWSGANGTSGNVSVSSSVGSGSLPVTISPQLTGGNITSASVVTINAGSIPPTITASAGTGGLCNNGLSYQWESSVDQANWTNVSGATGQNLVFNSGLTQNTWFRRAAFGGGTAYTGVVTIYAISPLTGGAITPSSQNAFDNAPPATINGGLPGGGNCSANYSYRWEQSTDGTNFSEITGVGGQSFSPPKQTVTTWFKRRAICGSESAYSNTVVVNVYPYPNAGTLSVASTTVSYNSSPGVISSTPATGGMCGGSYTYQWQSAPVGSNFTTIPDSTGETLTPGNITVNTQYRRVVTCGSITVNSATLVITVAPPLQPGMISTSVTNINKSTSPGTIFGTSATGGFGTYVYQWQYSTDGINFSNVNGVITVMYTPGNLINNIAYRRRVICGTETAFSNIVTILVNTGAPAALNMNYVRTRTFYKPLVTDKAVADINNTRRDVQQVTDYFDGLGRQIQRVTRQTAGTNSVDKIEPKEYDAFGRESNKYMLYTAGTDGNYKPDYLTAGQTFNAAQFPGESSFVSKEIFEASILNRTVKTMPQGSSWSGSDRGTTIQYMTATTTDAVRIWNSGSYTSPGVYPAGRLLKQIITDDNGKQTIEYRDKYDKVILRKVQIADAPSASHTGWLCTYYVHDDQRNITLIIQPRAVEIMNAANNWNLAANANLVPEYCYEYSYDQRNRQVMKRFPGAKEQYMVYDKYDRLILTQDGEQRKTNKWIFTKYDGLDRVIMTGIYTDASHIGLQAMKAYVESVSTGRYELRDNAMPDGYTTHQTFPVIAGGAADWLSVKYYDDYSWCTAQGMSNTRYTALDASMLAASNSTYPYTRALISSTQTRGLETGSKIRVLDDNRGANVTVLFYDDRDRVIQTENMHHGGATDYFVTQYSFSGNALAQYQRFNKGAPRAQMNAVQTRNTYDHEGRLLTVQKYVGGTGNTSKPFQVVVTNTYNNLGQLSQKKLGIPSAPIETLDYTYHIRGWLQGINIPYLQGTTTRYFGMELGYDKTTAAVSGTSYSGNRFNGDISGTIWKSQGDGIARKYDYQYDNSYRLTRADFTESNNGTWSNGVTDFTVYGAPEHGNKIGYDANGNILSLFQNGLKLTSSVAVDKLRYTYLNNQQSNRLQAVTEDASIGNADQQLADFTDNNTTATDFSYNDNGSLLTDANKRSNITYNIVGLPAVVTILKPDGTQKGTISFTYDANGRKLKKVVAETGKPVETTLYINGAVYKNDTLQHVIHDDGRVRYIPAVGSTPGKYDFDYFIKDHLQNVRAVITDEEYSNAYPLLNFEGAGNSTEIANQNKFYEDKSGASINVAGVRVTYPVSFTASNPPPTGATNTYALSVSKADGAIGAAKLMKVMSGDRIHAKVSYWYAATNANNSSANGGQSIVNSLLSALGQSAVPSGMIKGNVSAVTSALSANPDMVSLLNTNPATNGNNSAPKAYLNVIFFDEQFRYDKDNSRVFPVEYISDNLQRTIDKTMSNAVPVAKNGYAYVYFSNEAADVVYFDDFQITHERGRLLEETHYYPFGLTMKGISSRAMGRMENKNGYNSNELQRGEFSDGSGLELYDFNARTYDPQIGRFLQVDPLTEEWQEYMTPYQFGSNNPVRYGDPDGKILPVLAVIAIRFVVGAAVEYGSQVVSNYIEGKRGLDAWKTDWRGFGSIVLNGATSTVDPTGGFWKKFAISQATNVFESVAGQLLSDDDDKPGGWGEVTFMKTATDVLFMNVAGKVEKDISSELKILQNEQDRWIRKANHKTENRMAKAAEVEMKYNWAEGTNTAGNTAKAEATESALINGYDKWLSSGVNSMVDKAVEKTSDWANGMLEFAQKMWDYVTSQTAGYENPSFWLKR